MEKANKILKDVFGYDSFRPQQEEIITRILDKKDCLVLMPTGGGKSICFQIPALLFEGLTIVISPLISLMKDQVESLKLHGVKAEYLNSTLTSNEEADIRAAAQSGDIKLLYLSPEKLLSEAISWLQNMDISLVAIDEAHCVSMWGHDFRPEYTQLKKFRKSLSNVPFVALTATADKSTRKDIIRQLNLTNAQTFITSFDRENLSLEVRANVSKKDKIQEYIQFINQFQNDSGIIYCLSRKETEDIASILREQGINAKAYHAGLQRDERAQNQQDFINDDVQVICATIAFGMGIDKSNVRWIIHNNLPKNIEGFYQEIGRCGRDGLPATTILYYNLRDLILLGRFAQESNQSEVLLSKLSRMQEYAEATSCRRKILLSYFGEVFVKNCGNCDVCENPPTFFDGTVNGQKALSAVIRTQEKVGVNMLINILRGSGNRELTDKGYHEIKTYGAGADVSFNHWKSFITQMLNQGFLEIAYDDSFTLKTTDLGKDLLKGKTQLNLTEPKDKSKKVKSKKARKVVIEGDFSETLFEKLRLLRAEIARNLKVPAYVVFHDSTLKQMSELKPKNESEIINISGVSTVKAQKYGPAFMAIINEYLVSFAEEKPKKKQKGETYSETYKLYKEGLSIDEIAEKRALKRGTVLTHFVKNFEEGKDINLQQFLKKNELKAVEQASKELSPDSGLRDFYMHLEEKLSYDSIKIGLAILQSEKSAVAR